VTSSEQSPAHDADKASVLDEVVDPIGKVTRAVWVLVLIRGICAVVFGILALVAPLTTAVAVVYFFAAFALIEGVVEIVHAVRVRDRDKRWGWLLAMGIIAIIAAIVAFVFPGIAGLFAGTFILSLIAFYAVAMGIAGFPAAAAMTDGGRKVLGYIVSVLTIVFGIVLAFITLLNPAAAILNLIWVVGVWAIIIGVTLIIAAISARVQNRPASGAAAGAARG
jgi:uncharacterized membrane protein HdeD (DUF308 family)